MSMKNFQKFFKEPPDGCFQIMIQISNYDFKFQILLQVSELNKKLDELSLKGWIRPFITRLSLTYPSYCKISTFPFAVFTALPNKT